MHSRHVWSLNGPYVHHRWSLFFVDQTWLPLSKKHGTLGFCQTWPGKSSIYFGYFPTGWWFGTFFHILGTIIPFDFHIFQRGRSTTNQPSERNIWTPPLRGFPSVPRMAPEGNCLEVPDFRDHRWDMNHSHHIPFTMAMAGIPQSPHGYQ